MVLVSSRTQLATVLLVVLATGLTGCSRAAKLPKNKRGSAEFEAIRLRVTHGEYREAVPQLTAFIDANPSHPDASRAGMFIGKCMMAQGDLPAARQAFETTIETYPGTAEDHKCRYKLALLTLLEGDRQGAINQFETLANTPGGPLAPEATAMAAYLRKQANNE